jgi:hypothetical protein
MGACINATNVMVKHAFSNGMGYPNGESGRIDENIKKIKFICAPENYFLGPYFVGIWGEVW